MRIDKNFTISRFNNLLYHKKQESARDFSSFLRAGMKKEPAFFRIFLSIFPDFGEQAGSPRGHFPPGDGSEAPPFFHLHAAVRGFSKADSPPCSGSPERGAVCEAD
ncbi:MAG: hypothetical protein IJL32_16375 [Oscillospiraceae bacterium]|nr:hypothetical protein [Oscillospiraceae bacterium]